MTDQSSGPCGRDPSSQFTSWDLPLVHKFEGRWRQENAAGTRKLLHARCEMRGLSHRGVVHAQVAADRPREN